MLWFDRHRRFRACLSGYIDAQLSPKEARAVEAHFEGCDACRQELDELRATVMVMRDLPQTDIPRSFALSPEQIARPMALPLPSTPPLAIGMRLTGAALAFSLAVVLVADFGDFSGNGEMDSAVTQESANYDADTLRSAQQADGGGAPAAADVSLGEADDERKTLDADVECSVVTHDNGAFSAVGDAAATAVPEAIAETTPAPAGSASPDDSNCLADGAGAYFGASGTSGSAVGLDETTAREIERDRSPDARSRLSTLRWLEIVLAAALFIVLAGLAGAVTASRRR